MSFVFEDRKSNYPHRYKITPLSGESYYVYLERADEPTVVGTPLNADTFNTILNEFDMAGVLPKVSEADNGNLLTVSGGVWRSGGVRAFVGEEETIDDTTSTPKTTTRATCVVFTDGEEYILHSVGVLVATGIPVEFVLCDISDNKLTQIETLGGDVSVNGFAKLTIEGGRRIPANTAIVALTSVSAIEAYTVENSNFSFDDVVLPVGSGNIEIPYTEGVTALARMVVTITFPQDVPLNDFTREVSYALRNLDATISAKVDSYVAEALGGEY